jgi:PII-like signaling protein
MLTKGPAKKVTIFINEEIIVIVVDSEENIRRLIPAVAEMMDTGLMATSGVQMIRVQRNLSARAL